MEILLSPCWAPALQPRPSFLLAVRSREHAAHTHGPAEVRPAWGLGLRAQGDPESGDSH